MPCTKLPPAATGMKRPWLPLMSAQVAPMGWAIIHMATVAMAK